MSTEKEPLLRPRDPHVGLPIVRDAQALAGHRDLKNVGELLEILSWKRPFDSATEEHFARRYLDTIKGMEHDAFGNRLLRIPNPDGSASRVLWSSHIDTCHHNEGYQRLTIHKDEDGLLFVTVMNQKEGNCLGADDGTGVWIMRQLALAGKPGLYIFHRGEERGCLGSKWIVQNTPEQLKDIDCAIAFDRRDFDNIITHQGGERGCSERFAGFLSKHLRTFKADPSGMYTDTKQYFRHISECTNLSVGYQNQHGPLERQYLTFPVNLKDAILAMPIQDAPIVRDPTAVPERRYSGTMGSGEWSHNYEAWANRGQGDRIWCSFRRRFVTKGTEIEMDWDTKKQDWVFHDPAKAKEILLAEATAAKAKADAEKDEAEDDDLGPQVDPTTDPTKARQIIHDCELDLEQIIRKYTKEVAALLMEYGIDTDTLLQEIHGNEWAGFIYRHSMEES